MGNNKKQLGLFALACIILLASRSLPAQVDDFINTRKISLSLEDTTIVAGILADVKIEKVNQQAFYYWYANGTIFSNQGGYAGNLLHGEYVEYGQGGCLILRGQYERGLRSGIWMRWFPDGRIKETIEYEAGMLDGMHIRYARDGRIAHSAHYHQGILEGKMMTVEQDTLYRISYRNGIEKKKEAMHVFNQTQE